MSARDRLGLVNAAHKLMKIMIERDKVKREYLLSHGERLESFIEDNTENSCG
jgi:hypothetical protein